MSELIAVPRRTPEALTGGAGDVWSRVDNAEAFAEMPSGMAGLLRRLEADPRYALNSGRIQTIIRYRGVKLGGVNRRNSPHGYITSGVAASGHLRQQLLGLGFRGMEKPGKAHVHTWYQIPIREYTAFERGLGLARATVDQSLGAAGRRAWRRGAA